MIKEVIGTTEIRSKCFSKIPERVMYNRLYTFLHENNLLYKKQFGFQEGHSTDHAIMEIANQIHLLRFY